MLNQISIQDFAIIEKMLIDFNDGMTVITGQTGAGKSIVIDAISQLLGARANKLMVKDNQEYAYIEGVFDTNEAVINYLKDNEIELDDDYMIISKKIKKDLKSQIKINNRLITNEICRNIGSLLIEIHSQHDNNYFNTNEAQLAYIDSFFNKDQEQIKTSYKKEYALYQALLKEKDELLKTSIDPDLLPFYQEQLKDINDALLDEEEVKELEEKESYYKNYEKIAQAYTNVINELSNKDVLSSLKEINHNLSHLSDYSKTVEKYSSQFDSIYYELIDIFENIKNEYYQLDLDEADYEITKEKLFNYQKMIRKFSYSREEVEAKIIELNQRIDFILNSDTVLNDIENKIKKQEALIKDLSNKLDGIRKEYASDIENKIITQLHDLYLKDAQFKIDFIENNTYTSNGKSSINFMFSTNKGSSLKPLNLVASGGELARLVLGLKVIEASKDNRMYIFDEIDTGVSGEVADAIGRKIKEISQYNNVIVITHLPQVAVYASSHLFISKSNNDKFTTSNCHYLDKEEQVQEIASMLSAGKISDAAIENAKLLLENANNG